MSPLKSMAYGLKSNESSSASNSIATPLSLVDDEVNRTPNTEYNHANQCGKKALNTSAFPTKKDYLKVNATCSLLCGIAKKKTVVVLCFCFF